MMQHETSGMYTWNKWKEYLTTHLLDFGIVTNIHIVQLQIEKSHIARLTRSLYQYFVNISVTGIGGFVVFIWLVVFIAYIH